MQHPRSTTCIHQSARSAVTFIRKLNGSSQPAILVTRGLRSYVVKFSNFTGRTGLVAEVIGAEVMRLMGLPVPEWSPVQVDNDFINANPEIWFSNKIGAGLRPAAGLHFGSQVMLSNGERQTYQIIPQTWVGRIVNPGDFIGALLVDLWLNNCDRRQCLFLEQNGGLRAVFIDNDNMLGGYDGGEQTTAARVMAPYPELYRMNWQDQVVDAWMKKLTFICETSMDEIFARIPSEWAGRSVLERLRATLVRRFANFDSLLSEAGSAAEQRRQPISFNASAALQLHWHYI